MASLRITAAGLAILVGGTLMPAQTPVLPGRVAGIPEAAAGRNMSDLGPEATAPKTTIAVVPDRHERAINRLWVSSLFAVVGSTGMDAATSWGKREGNAFLASADGNFGAKGVAIKGAFAAGVVVPQIFLRKHRELKSAFIAGNFGEAAIFTGVSIHNLRIASAPKN